MQAASAYAAERVQGEKGVLAQVLSARRQVVAGTNLSMVLRLADGTIWEATVWHKLDGSYALTSPTPKP